MLIQKLKNNSNTTILKLDLNKIKLQGKYISIYSIDISRILFREGSGGDKKKKNGSNI